MSFAGSVKSELCRPEIKKHCCALAEAMGVLLYSNTFSPECIRVVTESRDFAQRLPVLFRRALGVSFDVLPEPEGGGKLTYTVTDPAKIAAIFEKIGFSAENSLSLHVNLALLENECCQRAFLRGAFLAGGSVTDPEKRYHLELSTTHQQVLRETDTLLQNMGLQARETTRKGSGILYFKQSDAIAEFLVKAGASINGMAVILAAVDKGWRNSANRKVNCDSANVDKAVAAAQEQLAAIRVLRERGVLEALPEKLRETALLREEYPESTLSELAELHEPPTTKSTVNHRMRKLLALAAEERS